MPISNNKVVNVEHKRFHIPYVPTNPKESIVVDLIKFIDDRIDLIDNEYNMNQINFILGARSEACKIRYELEVLLKNIRKEGGN